MNERLKIIMRIISAALIFVVLKFFDADGIVPYLIPYLIAGYDVLIEAVEGIREGEIFDEHFLMGVATVGALILGEYSEACAVMIFYQVGEFFSDYASDRTRESIKGLMDLRPDTAVLEHKDGTVETVNPSAVSTGSIIVVKAGERIPIDGVIIGGHSGIDTSALTGESMPRNVREGDEVLSGSVNLSGVLRVRTTCTFTQSTASKILALIEDSSAKKSHSENFITRFAKIYTPAVCLCAFALAVIPPLIFAESRRTWAYRALTFLVVSCPCALVVSVPLAFFAAVGGAGRRGILVKGGKFIERLAEISAVIFDKTGTLTQGIFEVSAVHTEIMEGNELLHLAAHAERFSPHPAAEALRRAYPDERDSCIVEDAEEIAGYGVSAKVNGETVCAGSSRLMERVGAKWKPCDRAGTIIHVSVDGDYAGHAVISDRVKDNAKSAVEMLRSEGVNRIVMFTGDNESSAKETADSLGITECFSGLLPADKAEKIREIPGVKAFVGDGINDAPVLSGADVGIAMGALGSDAAIEAADVVIMDDDLMKVPMAVRISRKCMGIVRQNVYGSIAVKMLCLVLGVLGLAGMRAAVFADVGVMVIAVMNSVRAMRAD
ncbi:MAG: cadmium-translocating P-type ATPase [Synergistaceae bacterium]|nr:cadmium-translocating P-type ATPase [Synergistaceae bacterium]